MKKLIVLSFLLLMPSCVNSSNIRKDCEDDLKNNLNLTLSDFNDKFYYYLMLLNFCENNTYRLNYEKKT